MPGYEWHGDRRAWIKFCSRCKEETIGTENEEESVKIFLTAYAPSTGRAQTADGLQSRCWECNSAGRRALGITRKILQEMLDRQGGICPICTKTISIERHAPAEFHAHVDHDEETGKVRDLLCGACNRGIGIFRHEVVRLHRAAKYLQKHTVVVPLKIVRRL